MSDQREWRDDVWKLAGIPEDVWPLMELLGVIAHPRKGRDPLIGSFKWKATDFDLYLPLVSDPSRCAILSVPDGAEGNVHFWKAILESLVEHRRIMVENK